MQNYGSWNTLSNIFEHTGALALDLNKAIQQGDDNKTQLVLMRNEAEQGFLIRKARFHLKWKDVNTTCYWLA